MLVCKCNTKWCSKVALLTGQQVPYSFFLHLFHFIWGHLHWPLAITALAAELCHIGRNGAILVGMAQITHGGIVVCLPCRLQGSFV